MDTHTHQKTRRLLFSRGLHLAAGAMLGIVGAATYRNAAAKMAKDAFLYQDHPHDGKRCADCKFFAAASNDPSMGTCAIVEGEIAGSGWCTAFSSRS